MAKLKDKIVVCLSIILSSILLAGIPFVIVVSYYGFQNKFYFILAFGFGIGIWWSIKVIRRGNYDDYDYKKIYQSSDIIETWEIEKKKNENSNGK